MLNSKLSIVPFSLKYRGLAIGLAMGIIVTLVLEHVMSSHISLSMYNFF